MDTYIDIQKAIAPEALQVVERRYSILRTVGHLAPVGRRMLAEAMQLGERVIRSEIETLKQLGLVESGAGGVLLTPQGEELLRDMTPYVKELLGLNTLEQQVALKLGISKVVVVPGDCDADNLVNRELGKAAARELRKQIANGDIIAITGGSTMSHVAESITPQRHKVTVVPGRGALGERVEIQANTIAAKLAQALGGNYRLLHAPDNLTRQALDELVRDPGISEVLNLIRQATILIHGIGDAVEMASRREVPTEQLADLKKLDAVAEAFGYYFNERGQIVWQANSIGLRLTDLDNIKTVIAVAGGAGKARAIRAVAEHHKANILVTDQGAAEAVINLPAL